MTLLTPASLQPFSPSERPLTPDEARVLGTLMEKARTVPDSYPMTLNTLLAGCNQKTSRDPLVTLSEAQAQQALDSLKADQLVRESSAAAPRATSTTSSARWVCPSSLPCCSAC